MVVVVVRRRMVMMSGIEEGERSEVDYEACVESGSGYALAG